jgi:hypothetical protein
MPHSLDSPLLIAEHDEGGALAWIWIWSPGDRGPRLAHSAAEIEMLGAAVCTHGTSLDEARGFLAARQRA